MTTTEIRPLRAMVLAALLIALTLLTLGCDTGDRTPSGSPQANGKLRLVTTVAPITSIVENVAGDKVQLNVIIPQGMDSHTFEPVRSDAEMLAAADLIILNGLDLEIPTLKLARANKKPEASILLLGDKTIGADEYVFDFTFPREKGHPNPHLWLDPRYAMAYAKLIRDELIRRDPTNESVYHQNTQEFLHRLDALDRAIAQATETIPKKNRRLLTYHDSWPYFARRYGFTVIGAAQPSDFSRPSPREIARLIDQIRREKVPALFGSEAFSSPVLKQIARETGTRYVNNLRDDLLPGAPGDPEHSYVGMMLKNTRAMVEALGGKAEPFTEIGTPGKQS